MSPQRSDTQTIQIGRWRVDPGARELSDGHVRKRISPRAMGVLEVLVEADGDVVRRDVLLDRVWPDVVVGEESLTTAVSELRRALGDRRGATRMVDTVQKTGYRLSVPVRRGAARPPSRGDELTLDAYLLIAEARRARGSGTPGSVAWAVALCEEACDIAESFAPAHAEHAVSIAFAHLYARGREGLDAAHDAAARACALRPELAVCHASRGYVHYADDDVDAARQALSQALALGPADVDTHALARCALFGMGQWRACASLAERAAQTQPDDCLSPAIAARAAEANGECARAATLALNALSRADALLEVTPDDARTHAIRGCMAAMLGYEDEARDSLARGRPGEPAFDVYAALTWSRLGEHMSALAALDDVIGRGFRHAAFLENEPLLHSLRGRPGFREMTDALRH